MGAVQIRIDGAVTARQTQLLQIAVCNPSHSEIFAQSLPMFFSYFDYKMACACAVL